MGFYKEPVFVCLFLFPKAEGQTEQAFVHAMRRKDRLSAVFLLRLPRDIIRRLQRYVHEQTIDGTV